MWYYRFMHARRKVSSSKKTAHKLHHAGSGKLGQYAQEKVTKETYPLLGTAAAKHVAERIRKEGGTSHEYTGVENKVCVISNGSCVHGYGNVGAHAMQPILESKALMLHTFGGVHAVPLSVTATQPVELAYLAEALAPSCNAILFDSIASPTCFTIPLHTQKGAPIPILESSQHGIAVVVLAGLINAHTVIGKDIRSSRIAVLGTGAPSVAIIRLLQLHGVGDIIAVDKDGILHPHRTNLDKEKEALAHETNVERRTGRTLEAVTGADVVISLSKSEALKEEYICMMAQKPIVFALREHYPEVTPKQAHALGATVIATRDYSAPNYVTDALILPHLIRTVLHKEIRTVPQSMCVALAQALAESVTNPHPKKILPTPFDRRIAKNIQDIF